MDPNPDPGSPKTCGSGGSGSGFGSAILLRINTAKAYKSFSKEIFKKIHNFSNKFWTSLTESGYEQLFLDVKVHNVQTVNVFSFQIMVM